MASACVWSMNLAGRKAWSSVSTEGVGASAWKRWVRSWLTISSSASAASARRRRRGARSHRRDGPAARSSSRSQPEPLTKIAATSLAEEVADGRLDRGVAAAVEDEIGLAPDQPRGVDAERQILAGFGVATDEGPRLGVRPTGAHGGILAWDPAPPAAVGRPRRTSTVWINRPTAWIQRIG